MYSVQRTSEMKFICFYVSLFTLAYSESSKCFEKLLEKTQSCDNKALMYATTEGVESGLGSEFNSYLIYSLLNAVMTNRRLVYLKSRRHWEYDCPLHLGWACYLQFRCNETGVFSTEMDFSDVRTTFHDRDFTSRDYPKICSLLESVYETNYKDGSDTSCDVKKTNPTILTSMAAKFLFNLNDHTKQFSKKFNERYMIDAGVPYVSLQLRSQDKKYEMSPEAWAWISNMQNVYDTIKPFIDEASGIKHLFVSTDNCTLLGELTPLLPSHIAVASPCHKHEGEDSHTAVAMTGDENQDLVGEFNPRRKDFRSAQRLFAEVLMLAGGQHFFGIMNSNLVRFIHRLRYPDHQNTSHGLACMLTPATQFKCKYDSMKT